MRVVGIDPGLARTGFGVVEWTPEGPRHIYNTCLTTPAGTPQPQRLKMLYTKVRSALTRFRPGVVVMERLFFAKNVRTATAVNSAAATGNFGIVTVQQTAGFSNVTESMNTLVVGTGIVGTTGVLVSP